MKREVFELSVGKRFRFNAMNYTVIRPYGNEHDNVLGIAENGRVVKFPVYMACEELPPLESEITQAANLEVNSVVRLATETAHADLETFMILATDEGMDEIRVKVLETGLLTTLNPYANVKVLSYGTSNS